MEELSPLSDSLCLQKYDYTGSFFDTVPPSLRED